MTEKRLPIGTNTYEEMLLSFGLSPKLLGYSYITYSLELIKDDPTYLRNITKRLYKDVAAHFEVQPYSVERNIRHAISCIFTHGDYEYINAMFVNCVQPLKGTPSNGEFLALLNLRGKQLAG